MPCHSTLPYINLNPSDHQTQTPSTPNINLQSSLLPLQMPLHNLLKNTLPIPHKTIPMTRNQILKPPAINPLHTSIEPLPITLTKHIPQHPLLPHRIAPRILQRPKELRCPPRRRINPALTILLRRRQIEQQIRFDERACWFVEEYYLFVGVCVDVFVFEFGIELLGDLDAGFVLCGEDRGEGDDGYALVFGVCLGALFGEAFGADDVRGGEGAVPGREVHMVFDVGGDEVGYWGGGGGEGGDGGFEGGGEGCGGEDGEGAGAEFDNCCSAAEFYTSKS